VAFDCPPLLDFVLQVVEVSQVSVDCLPLLDFVLQVVEVSQVSVEELMFINICTFLFFF